jgi:hypothetical protein
VDPYPIRDDSANEPIQGAGTADGAYEDRHPSRVAIILTIATIAAGLLYALWIMPTVTHSIGWWVLRDVWPPLLAGRYVSSGALGYLYAADPAFSAMPLGAILLAPVSSVGDALHLTDSSRFALVHPSLWLVYQPYALLLCGGLLLAGRRLMQAAWVRAGLFVRGVTPNHAWTQAGLAALVIVPAAIVSGQFAAVWAFACLLAGVRLALDGRWRGAALLFGVAVGFDLWAALAIPVLVASAPHPRRASIMIRALGVPAVLVAFPFMIDPSSTARALLHPLSFPTAGHALPWIHRTPQPVGWGLGRALAFLPAVAIAWWVRGRREPEVLFAALGLLFLIQPVFEAVSFAYQLCPAFALLFLFDRSQGRLGLRPLVLGSGLMLSYLLHPDPILWWMVVLAVATYVAWPSARMLLGIRAEDMPPEPAAQRSPSVPATPVHA